MIKKIFSVNDVKKKIGLTVFYIAAIGILRLFQSSCIFLTFLNIPCPGCGMVRAFVSFFNLDIVGAFNNHLMFWSMPILYLYFWFDGHLFKNPKIDKAILITIFVGFLINWIKALIFR